MPDCSSIEPLVTPYVDGELPSADRQLLEQHLGRCPPCRARVGSEQAVRDLLQARKPFLRCESAPLALRAKCASLSQRRVAVRQLPARGAWRLLPLRSLPARLAPFTMAAALVLIVVGAFVYRITDTSPGLMAAELTADHVKCFMMNAVLRTHQSPATVESALASGFDWNVQLPDDAGREGLDLVGSRPCLYGQGKVAHIMYRHNGQPVSLFMLPRSQRPDQLVNVLGHEAAIWSVGDRSFVLVAREPRAEMERMAAFVKTAMK